MAFKFFSCTLGIFFISLTSISQTCKVNGVVKDVISLESLPGSVITWSEGNGTVADLDGNFEFTLPYGSYSITFKSVGYMDEVKTIQLTKSTLQLQVEMINILQNEIIITSDYAIGRRVPVAVSNISAKRMEEELASRDIAMLVNTTPGAYATRLGGGDGDARVTIRGFGDNNVAVMLDGVPVNDMENGAVYWSNWFGLDVVMNTTQIQRGLGASKLVIPATGGTINIITKGIEQKRMVRIKEEYVQGGFLRTSVGLNSGKLKNGWAFSAAGSFKKGNGWVQGTHTQGFFWYGKVEKIIGNHTISAYALGAPQSHGQRSRADAIALYDRDLAVKLGATTTYDNGTEIPEYGIYYNSDVGPLQRYSWVNGEATDFGKQESFNGRKNYYHKPQFSLKDVWNINENSFLSTVLYASIGNGGGTNFGNTPQLKEYLSNGDLDVQGYYDLNIGAKAPVIFGTVDVNYNINPLIDPKQRYVASNFIRANVNNHRWYGGLSTYSNKLNDELQISAGLDVRMYKGEHYSEVYDLLGADYLWLRNGGLNPNETNVMKKVGDKINFHNDALINWGGLFGQVEYDNDIFTCFFSASFGRTGYKRIDYFRPKVVKVGDEEISVAYELNSTASELIADTAWYNGVGYTPDHPDAQFQETDWHIRNTFTAKAGINFKINEWLSAFINSGIIDKAPLFNQVFNNSNALFTKIYNEKITSFEFGMIWQSKKVNAHLNLYATKWANRPFTPSIQFPNPADPQEILSINVQGITSKSLGFEYDFAYKIHPKLTIEGLLSIGDWRYASRDTIIPVDENNEQVTVDGTPDGEPLKIPYDAVGVHTHDAAQFQLGGFIRFEPIKDLYFNARVTWFKKYFARTNLRDLNGENAGRDSFLIPGYNNFEIHGGYGMTVSKVRLDLRFSVFNVFDQRIITDAYTNYDQGFYNSEANDFNSSSSGVFIQQGRWFTSSFTVTF